MGFAAKAIVIVIVIAIVNVLLVQSWLLLLLLHFTLGNRTRMTNVYFLIVAKQ